MRWILTIVLWTMCSLSFGALSSNMTWEVRADGSDTNGGGYKPDAGTTDYSQQAAAQLALTDLVTNGTTTVTSATGGFTAAMVGNVCYIAGGTAPITAGWYQIATYVSTNEITVDRSTGLSAGTGATCNVGGALASPGCLNSLVASYHHAYIRAGTYTMTTTTPGAAGPVAPASYGRYEGYGSTRGDYGGPPVISAGSQTGIRMWTTHSSYYQGVTNILLDGNDGAGNDGWLVGSDRTHLTLCGARNFSENAADEGFNVSGPVSFCYAYDCGIGFIGTSAFLAYGCVAYSNVIGFSLSSQGKAFNSLAYSNTGDGFTLGLRGYLSNCTAYGNSSDGIDFSDAGSAAWNCLSVSNGAWGYNDSSSSEMFNCGSYNNTSGRTGTMLIDRNPIALSGDPFVNAAGDDFRLNDTAGAGASCLDAGIGVVGQVGPDILGPISPSIDFPTAAEVESGVVFGYNSNTTGTLSGGNVIVIDD